MSQQIPSNFRPCNAQRNSLKKNPKSYTQTPQTSVSALNVKIQFNTVRKTLHKYGLFGRVASKKPLLSKKNSILAQVCKIASELKPQDYWNNIFWTDTTKVEMFGCNAHYQDGQKSGVKIGFGGTLLLGVAVQHGEKIYLEISHIIICLICVQAVIS